MAEPELSVDAAATAGEVRDQIAKVKVRVEEARAFLTEMDHTSNDDEPPQI